MTEGDLRTIITAFMCLREKDDLVVLHTSSSLDLDVVTDEIVSTIEKYR